MNCSYVLYQPYLLQFVDTIHEFVKVVQLRRDVHLPVCLNKNWFEIMEESSLRLLPLV